MQDEVESRALFRLLENEVVPLFYDRDDKDLPRRWIEYVKKSLSNVCPQFNTHRMLEDYAEIGYLPSSERFVGLMGDEQQGAKQLGGWVAQDHGALAAGAGGVGQPAPIRALPLGR